MTRRTVEACEVSPSKFTSAACSVVLNMLMHVAAALCHDRRLSPVRRNYGERLPVVSVDNWPGVEVGENGLLELCVVKCEEMAHVSSIIEGHFTTAVIQIDSHPTGGFGGIYQAVLQVGARFVLTGAVTVVPLHHGPKTVLWAKADLILPVDGGSGHAQTPGRLGAHIHLPVVSARGVGLRAQDDVVEGEALRVVGQVRLDFSHLDTGATRGNPQAGVGCVRVEGHTCDSCNIKNKNRVRNIKKRF